MSDIVKSDDTCLNCNEPFNVHEIWDGEPPNYRTTATCRNGKGTQWSPIPVTKFRKVRCVICGGEIKNSTCAECST